MQGRDRLLAGALVLFLSAFPLGFVLHASPRFPGSFIGSTVGIAGGSMMLVPLAYLIVKRVSALRTRITRYVTLSTLLSIHVYSGVVGPILGVLHSAHKFRSPLGISLTGMMLVVVLSGYLGRYFLGQISAAVRGRQSELAMLSAAFEQSMPPAEEKPGHKLYTVGRVLKAAFFRPHNIGDPTHLAAAVADLEYAVRAEEVMRDLFSKWLKLHIVIATILYLLLLLHVWSALYFGLRWL